MTILNKDFYPSTDDIIRKLCACIYENAGEHDRRGVFILDPSGGDGRVLDYITNVLRDRYGQPHLYACELEPELAALIEGKGFPVLARDFLEYTPKIKFDYIISNVPFSQAARFVCHAWEIVERQSSGTIVFVLPKTILRDETKHGLLANTIIQQHGVKNKATGLPYDDLGRPFSRAAERTTSAECILVKLVRQPETERLDFDYRNDTDTERYTQQFAEQETGLMPTGFIGRKLATYNALLEHFAQYRAAHKKMASLLEEFEGSVERDRGGRGDGTLLKASEAKSGDDEAWSTFYEMLTEAAWNGILEHPGFQRSMTTRAKNMITEFRRSRNRLDFTEGNIHSMFMALVGKSDELLKQCVFDAFDHMSKFFWGNRVHVEGWKSNKAHMVNTRCVLPNAVEAGYSFWHISYYSMTDKLNDIDKGLCVVMGIPVGQLNLRECPACKSERLVFYSSNDDEDGGEGLNCRAVCLDCKHETPAIRGIVQALEAALKHPASGDVCYSRFFKIRYYGKGTVHLYFRDMEVWQRFNCTASRLRGWLPDDTSYERLKVKRRKPSPEAKARYAQCSEHYDPDGERMAEDVSVEIAPKLSAPGNGNGNSNARPSASASALDEEEPLQCALGIEA